MTMDVPRRSSLSVLHGGYEVLIGLLLFGDYLALTASRALTGSAGNWILIIAVLQAGVLGLALLLGKLRGRLPWSLILGYATLAAVMLGHVLVVALNGDELDSYAEQKVVATTVLLGPALLCGIAIGGSSAMPGGRSLPAMLVPLLAMCFLAVVSDPRQLTIAYFDALPVWFGFLVMPAHQGLACCLAKAALASFAFAGRGGKAIVGLLLHVFVGGLVGLALLTGARSYVFGLLGALAVQLVVGSRRVGIAALAILLALVLFQTFAPELVYDRFDFDSIADSIAFREREEAWTTAWSAFLDHPWTGLGPGGFSKAMNFSGRVYPHNMLLELASELGVFGLAGFALMVVPVFWRCARAVLKREVLGSVQVFAIGLLVFGLCGAMSVGDLIRNHFVFFALGMAATCFSGPTRAAGVSRPAAGRPPRERQA